MNVSEFRADVMNRFVVRRVQRQRDYAAVAVLNWRVETRDLIESEVHRFSPRGCGRWVPIQALASGTTFQVNIFTDERLPKELGSDEWDLERPASLVYSLHPNGSVVVIASPHSSAHAGGNKPDDRQQSYFLDVVPHVWQLAGVVGRARVRRHLRVFNRFATVTRAHAHPSPRSGRFLRGLEVKSEQFTFVFQSTKDARIHRLSQESNMVIGLAAGLIGSTIFPLVRDYGKEMSERAAEMLKKCGQNPEVMLETCLKNHGYYVDKMLGEHLTTGDVLIIVAVLFAAAVLNLRVITWRR